jgi:hypothetical protein
MPIGEEDGPNDALSEQATSRKFAGLSPDEVDFFQLT